MGGSDQIVPNYFDRKPDTVQLFVGKILKNIGQGDYDVQIRNKIRKDDTLEILTKSGPALIDHVIRITDKNGNELMDANPNDRVILTLTNRVFVTNDLIRVN